MAIAGLLTAASSVLGGMGGGKAAPGPDTSSATSGPVTVNAGLTSGSMSYGMSPVALVVLGVVLYLAFGPKHKKGGTDGQE